MRREMEKANFKSVRGPFRYGNNHMPIQDFYVQTAVKEADGSYTMKTVTKMVENAQDRYHDKCPMP
jgi:branched-chain amino acid transport system substrate-binding protein